MKGIQYLTYDKINKKKWDHCVSEADNSLIYAFSYYLDTFSDNWDALVLNDYEAVMPLTWRKKYNVKYLYQPAFTAMLGIFGKPISAKTTSLFLEAIPPQFKFIDIFLNPLNKTSFEGSYEKKNYESDLTKSYLQLYGAYRENLKRNINRSVKAGNTIVLDIPVKKVISLAKEFKPKNDVTTDIDYKNFASLFTFLKEKERAVTYGVFSKTGQLLASAVFIMDKKRAYYILVGNHPDGKTAGASHALIDAFIKNNAGKDLVLDFEGSDISSLAFFYENFGAIPVTYPGLKINRLPKLLRWLKQ